MALLLRASPSDEHSENMAASRDTRIRYSWPCCLWETSRPVTAHSICFVYFNPSRSMNRISSLISEQKKKKILL